ncbi:hypothetical protein HK102_011821 [Quaeritorhiza haematococci]|nr:hypothetical protein HK102_011821 [Quaeritorhiza haematococci]
MTSPSRPERRDSVRTSVSSATSTSEVLRHRNKRRDDAIRKKVEQELARKTTSRTRNSSISERGAGGTPTNGGSGGVGGPGGAGSSSNGGERASTHGKHSHHHHRSSKGGTVASLRPAPAITVFESARIVQAAQIMAAKRVDAVLVVNEEGHLTGILTDKDIAFRVVAEGYDVRATTVASVMTQDPISVYDKGSRNDALSTMVQRGFRHLPVISEVSTLEEENVIDGEVVGGESRATNVVGLLDITRVVFDRLDELEKKVTEDTTILQAMEALERRGTISAEHVGTMRAIHGCPDVGSIISRHMAHLLDDNIPEVPVRASVREAARTMKERHQTGVLIVNHGSNLPEEGERLAGIFTTKDIVLRVLAAGLDPNTTSVVRVMTPHPDSVSPEVSILDALKKLYSEYFADHITFLQYVLRTLRFEITNYKPAQKVGHYMHLPVVDDKVPIGLVDVQQLTMAMFNYLLSKDSPSDPNAPPQESGPMWQKFWNSTFAGSADSESDRQSLASESVSQYSGYHTSPVHHHGGMTGMPPPPIPSSQQGSVIHHRHRGSVAGAGEFPMSEVATSLYSQPVTDELHFAFKLRDSRTGKVFRFSSRVNSFRDLMETVRQKTGDPFRPSTPSRASTGAVADDPNMRLCYLDDENDLIYLASDRDLEEAVQMARRAGWSRLMLFYGEPPDDVLGKSGALDDSATNSPLFGRRNLPTDVTSTPGDVILRNQAGQVVRSRGAMDGVLDFFREAPMPVNVAISAAVVVVAVALVRKLTN